MPFQSKAQEAFMYAKHPDIAKKWQSEFGQPKKLPEFKQPKEIKSPWLNMDKNEEKKP